MASVASSAPTSTETPFRRRSAVTARAMGHRRRASRASRERAGGRGQGAAVSRIDRGAGRQTKRARVGCGPRHGRHHHDQQPRRRRRWRSPGHRTPSIIVIFQDGSRAQAELRGADPISDIAVLQVKNKPSLQPITIGTSKNLAVGQGRHRHRLAAGPGRHGDDGDHLGAQPPGVDVARR